MPSVEGAEHKMTCYSWKSQNKDPTVWLLWYIVFSVNIWVPLGTMMKKNKKHLSLIEKIKKHLPFFEMMHFSTFYNWRGCVICIYTSKDMWLEADLCWKFLVWFGGRRCLSLWLLAFHSAQACLPLAFPCNFLGWYFFFLWCFSAVIANFA